MIFDNAMQLTGNTPYIKVKTEIDSTSSIYAKLEGYNPTGSIKDRPCLKLIQDAIADGRLRQAMTILDASSGNLGCALAYYSKLLGFDAEIVASSKITQEKFNFMRYYGATVRKIGDFTIEGNHYCRELAQRNPDKYCFLDQLHNSSNPQAHYQTTGPEILNSFPDLQMVVASLGSGGTILGVGQYLKERHPKVNVAAVQAAVGTRLPGTASLDEGDYVSPFIAEAYESGTIDYTVKITEAQAISATMELKNQGIFVGLQTGGVLSAARILAQDYSLKGDIVIVSGDFGWKNLDKLLSVSNIQNRANRSSPKFTAAFAD